MNFRQLLGLIILSLGVVLVISSFDGRWCPESQVKSEVITNSPVSPTERLPEEAQVDLSKDYPQSTLVFLGGILMVISGVFVAIRFKS
jgi:hypothetical protein